MTTRGSPRHSDPNRGTRALSRTLLDATHVVDTFYCNPLCWRRLTADAWSCPTGAHDDVANAVAGLSEELFGRARGLTPADLYEMRSPIGDELGLTGYQARYLKIQDNGPSESKRESLSSPLGS